VVGYAVARSGRFLRHVGGREATAPPTPRAGPRRSPRRRPPG
jgi:hypothetical protein